jgi:hypothetical protein
VNKKINEISIMNNELKKEIKYLNISELEEKHEDLKKKAEVIKNFLESDNIETDENMYNIVVDDVNKILRGNERLEVLDRLKNIYNSYPKLQIMSKFINEEESMLIHFSRSLDYTNKRINWKLCKDNLKLCEEELNDLKKNFMFISHLNV